jgi:WG containing repeat
MGAQDVPPPLFLIGQNGKYGYIDNTGNVVVQPQFVWASEFKGGFADLYVCGRIVSMDEKGNLLPHLRAKLEARKSGDKFGFVDASGQFRIPAQYDEAGWFSEGLAAVRVGNKWGYIDEAGHTAIVFQYGLAMAFKHGRAQVIFGEFQRVNGIGEVSATEDGNAVIDATGRIIVKGLDSVRELSEGRMAAEKNHRWGYLDADGVPVTRFVYEDANVFADGLAAVQKKERWGYIDKNGKVVIPFMYEDVDNFSEGLASVKKDGKSGYIDNKGRIVIPPEFDEAGKFQTGLAAVIRGKESGFIDRSGDFAFKLVFDYASPFRDARDLSQFWTKDDHFGYVDHSGRVLWESAAPDDLTPFLFPRELEQKREESCIGITDDVKKKVAQFPPEP